jgi:hypothetical protein
MTIIYMIYICVCNCVTLDIERMLYDDVIRIYMSTYYSYIIVIYPGPRRISVCRVLLYIG